MAVVLADRGLPHERPRTGVQSVDVTHLAGGDDHGGPLDRRRDRRRLQVVVHEVVGHGLVVPAQLPGRRVQVHRAVRVELPGRVLDRLPDALVRVPGPECHRAVAAHQRRLPGPARAEAKGLHALGRVEDRVELP